MQPCEAEHILDLPILLDFGSRAVIQIDLGNLHTNALTKKRVVNYAHSSMSCLNCDNEHCQKLTEILRTFVYLSNVNH